MFNLCAKCVQNSRLGIKITPLEEKSSNFIHLTRYNCSTRNISQYIKRYSMQGNATTVPPAFNHIFTHYDFPGSDYSRGSLFIS